MKFLVTGAGGFLGGYLVERLLADGHEVVAWTHRPSAFLEGVPGALTLAVVDVTNREHVLESVGAAKPDVIFHLAAQSYPSVSWRDPAHTFSVNLNGTVHLLDAIRQCEGNPLAVLMGSSSEYAVVKDGRPIPETGALGPSSLYGVSKLAQHHMAGVYGERHGLRIVCVRPFFLVGPRKKGDVVSDFARRVVAVERGEATDVPVGSLDVVRDFLDVRDGVSAFLTIAAKGIPGETYNVCSGAGQSIGDVLDGYRSLVDVEVIVRQDEALLRPVEEMVKIGDPGKLKGLGWGTQHAFEQTLRDTLEYWRCR
jgi:GDP-4-dehydro-6-deoxy-D-mannose reductase